MVLSNKRTRLSARALKNQLDEIEYKGRNINFGCSELHGQYGEVVNKPESVYCAVNKQLALETMQAAEIPTPLISESDARTAVLNGEKIVGRKMYHSKGRGFYLASTGSGIDLAKKRGATHFLKYIEDAEEFRVHIVGENSIKISQKVFPEGTIRRNVRFGATFEYPHEFAHKKTLRKWAKESIKALGLDFGAVDLLYKDEQFYVLEVNTAPCLTDDTADTCLRYAEAFRQTFGENE